MGFLPPNPRWREYPPDPPFAPLYSGPAYARDTLNKNSLHSEDIFTITEIMLLLVGWLKIKKKSPVALNYIHLEILIKISLLDIQYLC
jgi:hypothetical protein